ncbi:TonB family protein [Larkinella soli]|uniref:TonB family protein n=1 Tax=Larkinella soli TaxID=1770527 RepID=UPI000FFCB8EB|nr:TonB family protein [Larkinella soli]
MKRAIHLLSTFLLLSHLAVGQCEISQDSRGRVITTCHVYAYQTSGPNPTPLHNLMIYLGSEYLTFPVWQPGKVRLGGRDYICTLAYNVVKGELAYKLDQTTTVERSLPEGFTVGGLKFVRLPTKAGGRASTYFEVLYDGNTQLLRNYKRQLKAKYEQNGYDKEEEFKGYFETQTFYSIRKGNAAPEPVLLTRRSALDVLADPSGKIGAGLQGEKLRVEDLIQMVKEYDNLTAGELNSRPSLTTDPLFQQVLRTRIKYPTRAWNERVYGRVYAGFEVDDRGRVQNVTLLSPDNGGYGFEAEVKQALKKMPDLPPGYAGKYALPVAFTLTNTAENRAPYQPVNQLPAGRLADRTLLKEITVPIIISKAVPEGTEGREVWGYFK